MGDEYKMVDNKGNSLDPETERIVFLRAQAMVLFDDYHSIKQNQGNFITLNEDFVVELLHVYGLRFWSGNTIVLSIHGPAGTMNPSYHFDGTEDDFYLLTAVIGELLQVVGDKYASEKNTIEEKSFEVTSALAQKYRDQD